MSLLWENIYIPPKILNKFAKIAKIAKVRTYRLDEWYFIIYWAFCSSEIDSELYAINHIFTFPYFKGVRVYIFYNWIKLVVFENKLIEYSLQVKSSTQ